MRCRARAPWLQLQMALLALALAAALAIPTSAFPLPPFPPQVDLPTVEHPFIFLHLAKCAGTSLRSLLFNRTAGTGVEVCIPSYTHSFLSVSRGGCGYSGQADSPRPAIMAGHFLWREYDWMLDTARGRGYAGDGIPCFTSIREPIDRLVSLYYYMSDRLSKKAAKVKLLQDMSPSEALAVLSDIWPVMRQTPLLSHFGNFGGVPTRKRDWVKQPEALVDEVAKRAAAEAAIKNLVRCVVGDMADEQGSTELIQHFFPWMQFEALPHLNTRETHSDKVRGPVGSSVKSGANNATRSAKDRMHDPLQPRVRAALELHYKEEVEVYRVAKRVHEAQVAYVRSLLAQRTLPSVPMPHHARNPNSNSKML